MLTKLKLHTMKMLQNKFRKWKYNVTYSISKGVVLNLIPVFKQSIEAFANLYYLLMHSHFNQSNSRF